MELNSYKLFRGKLAEITGLDDFMSLTQTTSSTLNNSPSRVDSKELFSA